MTIIDIDTSPDALTQHPIQRAIDAAADQGGGTVRIPAGTYHLRDAVHLRSGVHLVGEAGAVLRKVPSAACALTQITGFGHREFTPAEPALFDVGDGVHLDSDTTGGFLNCVATVTERRGDTFYIDQPAHYDYRPHEHARATRIHPLIEATDVRDASVRHLRLDGSPETIKLNGCRGGGVFLLRSERVTVEACEIDRFNGDGISFQQCIDIRIDRCTVHHCIGHGLHPGSGSVRYVITHNEAHHNGGDGLFYCLRTSHAHTTRNHLHHNTGAGISVGERDTDHLIEHNRIHDNAGPGVLFRPPVNQSGDRTRLVANIIGPNHRGDGDGHGDGQGRGENEIAGGLCDVTLLDNTVTAEGGVLAHIGAGCQRVCVADNMFNGRPQRGADVAGAVDQVSLTRPETLFAVGPAALPLDGARHLGVEMLPVWP